MAGFYFTFLAVLLAGLGARDQLTVARLTQVQGARLGVLLTALAVSAATAALAAWGASVIAPQLPAKARLVLAAFALGLAGAESLLLGQRRKAEEPTHSLGALAIVLFAHQLTDSVRLLVFAVAVATNAPVPAGLAGAAAGSSLLAAGWFAPELVTRPAARMVRRLLGAGMVLVALGLAASAFGRL